MRGPKRIMLPVNDDHGLEGRLTVAIALARQVGGSLQCIVVDALVGEFPLADLVAVSPMIESTGGTMVEPVAKILLLRGPPPLFIAPVASPLSIVQALR